MYQAMQMVLESQHLNHSPAFSELNVKVSVEPNKKDVNFHQHPEAIRVRKNFCGLEQFSHYQLDQERRGGWKCSCVV
jgi:hypothetical protein